MQQKDSHVFIGMQLDLSPTKFKPEFMCDAHNVRITPSDKEDTYLSLTNERGTLKVNLSLNLSGYYLGHCTASLYNETLNKDEDIIIVFCTNPGTTENPNESPDSIYKITLNNDVQKPVEVLYNGNLNFSIEHPIETFFISEAIDINKVYWNDGYNQPRVLNLNNIKYDSQYNKVDPSDDTTWILENIRNTQFDFVSTLDLLEEINIVRYSLGGQFTPGIILYAFSYYNKFGQLSTIFYVSPLQYIIFDDRGGGPDEFIPNSFKITISNWQSGFDYIRIYSIHRTTLNATPECRIVLDIDLRNIDGDIVFVDNGQIGEFMDPLQFPYIGGQNIIAQTWCLKDNTLFLGNVTLNTPSISELNVTDNNEDINIVTYVRENSDNMLSIWSSGARPLNQAGFKCGEEYRFGFLALYKDGSWSEPIWIKDFTIPMNLRPQPIDSDNVSMPIVRCVFPIPLLNALNTALYKKVRGLCVFPKYSERNVVAQGIVAPTVKSEMNINATKSISSWFFRTSVPSTLEDLYPAFKHLDSVKDEFSLDDATKKFKVNLQLLTFHSPDIEFDMNSYYLDQNKLLLNVFGYVEFNNISVDRNLLSSTPSFIEEGGMVQDLVTNNVLKLPLWYDGEVKVTIDENNIEVHELAYDNGSTQKPHKIYYMVYPWHKTGSLNNDIPYRDGMGTLSALLKSKVISRLLDTNRNDKKITPISIAIKNLTLCNVDEPAIYYLKNPSDTIDVKYQGIVDTVLSGKYYIQALNNKEDYSSTSTILYNPLTRGFIDFKYKSPTHLVINLDNNILPRLSNVSSIPVTNLVNGNNLDYILRWDVVNAHSGDTRQLWDMSSLELWRTWLEDEGSTPRGYTFITQLLEDGEGTSGVYGNILSYSQLANFIIGEPFLLALKYTSADNSFTEEEILVLGILYPFTGTVVDNTDIYVSKRIMSDYLQGLNIPFMIKCNVNGTLETRYYSYNSTNQMWVRDMSVNNPTTYYVGLNVLCTELPRVQVGTSNPPTPPTLVFNYALKQTPDDLVGIPAELGGVIELVYLDEIDLYKLELEIANSLTVIQSTSDSPHLFICDLIRDPSTIVNKFGGQTEEALKSNTWLPVSKAYNIVSLLEEATQSNPTPNRIIIDYGDTWFLKYYCLKTYPYSTLDENQIIEKAGFYCETRYNLYGVYDKDKPSTLLFINKDNFNKFNRVYSLLDNFFNYRILDKEFYTRNNFPYSFLWTKEKVNTAEIDNYTDINLVSSLDVNSVGGEISKLIVHNGLILCFQPDGLNRILFNSRVLIPVSDGVPIEIANSTKLEGVTNITNVVGCENKWAALSTTNGLFFIDNRRKALFVMGDEGGPLNLSASLNMNNWFSKNDFTQWYRDSSGKWHGSKLCDDYNGNSIYLIKEKPTLETSPDEGALVYSKRLNLFTSFMSYGETDAIFNSGNYLYALRTDNQGVSLYKMNEGNYNYFFDEYKPFDFTFVSVGNSEKELNTLDKTFTNLELRASFTNDGYFSYIQAKNDYQDTGVCTINKNALSSNRHFSRGDTARKFRIWRTDIPRVLENGRRTLNRVRNIWTKIKLGVTRESATNLKMELHDINVLYHV